jgi:hypothetical protein
MELEPWSRAALGLRQYVREVAERLDCTGDAFLVQTDAPVSAYLPLTQQLYGFPGRDAALLWHHRHGWSAEVDDSLVVAHLGDDPLPPPDEVAEFVADLVAGRPRRRRGTVPVPADVLRTRLAAYAPALEHV